MSGSGPPAGSPDALVEAVLFASSHPLDAATLASATLLSRDEVHEALSRLDVRYAPGRSGIVLRRVAGGYQLASSPECSGAIERLRGESRPAPLSAAATEVLAAVLYFGPLTRAAVSASRGVNSDAVVRSLIDRGLLAAVGSDSDSPGAPATLDVTGQLLAAAGASSREDFPALESLVEEDELQRVRERVAGASEPGASDAGTGESESGKS